MPSRNTNHGRKCEIDSVLDSVVMQNASHAHRRYGHVCASRLQQAASTMSLDPILIERYLNDHRLSFATAAPISFELAMLRIDTEPQNLDRSIDLYKRVRDRRQIVATNRSWVVVSRPIFTNTEHKLHKNALDVVESMGATMLCCTETKDINCTPLFMMCQCACCGAYTRECVTSCGCGAIRACSHECLRAAADEFTHDCFEEDHRIRSVCARIITSQPTFPYVNLIDPKTNKCGIPIHAPTALSLLHHCPADIGVPSDDEEVVDALVYECSTIQMLLLGAACRLSDISLHSRTSLRYVEHKLKSTVNSQNVVILS